MVVSLSGNPKNQENGDISMKTEAIQQSIINNYKILAKKTAIKSNQGDIKTIWGLQYSPNNKQEGFVSEIGSIGRKKAKIEIRNNELKTIKKPLLSTWSKTLKSINTMLEDIIANFDNPDIVTKRYVNLLCFPVDVADRLASISQKLVKKHNIN